MLHSFALDKFRFLQLSLSSLFEINPRITKQNTSRTKTRIKTVTQVLFIMSKKIAPKTCSPRHFIHDPSTNQDLVRMDKPFSKRSNWSGSGKVFRVSCRGNLFQSQVKRGQSMENPRSVTY